MKREVKYTNCQRCGAKKTTKDFDNELCDDCYKQLFPTNIIKCCFCKKEIDKKHSHDPRPIVSEYGDRCCSECNKKIVVPTRKAIWDTESKLNLKIQTYQDALKILQITFNHIKEKVVDK